MNRGWARWGIVLSLALLSGCATGTNERLVSQPAAAGQGNGGARSLFGRRDPMQQAQARVQPTTASNAPDERLARYFPAMAARADAPVAASRPAGRALPAPAPGGPRLSPTPDGSSRQTPDDADNSLSTLPVAVTVSLRSPSPIPLLPPANVSAFDPAPSRQQELPTVARNAADPSVMPASVEVPEAPTASDGKSPALMLPGDLSFSPLAASAQPDPKPVAPASTASAQPTAAQPAPPVLNAPPAVASDAPAQRENAPAPVEVPSAALTGPQYVEPMLIVSDPPKAAAEPAPARVAAVVVEVPAPEVIPAPPPAPALPAPSGEPTLEPRASTSPDPIPAPKPAVPPAVASASQLLLAPLPDPSLPAPPADEAPPRQLPAQNAPVPTVIAAPRPQAALPVIPPLPSKQMPRLSPQAVYAQAAPAPVVPPQSLLSSLWPSWMQPKAKSSPAPAPRSFVAGLFGTTWTQPQTQPAASAQPRPTVAFRGPPKPVALAPTTSPKRVETADAKTRVVHAHGCPHHTCETNESSPWFGVNRTLETAAMFPPTYYETVVLRNGKPYAAPPAPTVASVRNPTQVPPTPTPAVAVTPRPVAAAPPQAKPKRVWLITRLWNRIHGPEAVAPSTAYAAPSSVTAPPANVAATPGSSSGNAVTGDLPQRGEPVERVSVERVNEPAQR